MDWIDGAKGQMRRIPVPLRRTLRTSRTVRLPLGQTARLLPDPAPKAMKKVHRP